MDFTVIATLIERPASLFPLRQKEGDFLPALKHEASQATDATCRSVDA